MIAYKNFIERSGKLYPWWHFALDKFEAYPLNTIITRADNCGPFACWPDILTAKYWRHLPVDVTHKVWIKESKDKRLWVDYEIFRPPPLTILADEFEILEKVK